MSEREVTLGVHLVRKVGWVKATKVAAFVVAWGIYTEKTSEPYTLDGYSGYWKQSESTTYRERDLFRMCFPEDKVPDRVWAFIRSAYDERLTRKNRDLGTAQVFSVRGRWV